MFYSVEIIVRTYSGFCGMLMRLIIKNKLLMIKCLKLNQVELVPMFC